MPTTNINANNKARMTRQFIDTIHQDDKKNKEQHEQHQEQHQEQTLTARTT